LLAKRFAQDLRVFVERGVKLDIARLLRLHIRISGRPVGLVHEEHPAHPGYQEREVRRQCV
jgi:hypothetical protein